MTTPEDQAATENPLKFKLHNYWPDYQAQGDCKTCGHTWRSCLEGNLKLATATIAELERDFDRLKKRPDHIDLARALDERDAANATIAELREEQRKLDHVLDVLGIAETDRDPADCVKEWIVRAEVAEARATAAERDARIAKDARTHLESQIDHANALLAAAENRAAEAQEAARSVAQHTLELERALSERDAQAIADLEWLRGQVFALCEDTEAAFDTVALADDNMGSYARGRIKEAKGIRSIIGEVVRCRLSSLPTSTLAAADVLSTAAELHEARDALYEIEAGDYDELILTARSRIVEAEIAFGTAIAKYREGK